MMTTDDGAQRRAGDPAVHPRAARRAPRPPRARGARRDRTRIRDREGVLARSRRGPLARGGPSRRQPPADDARPQGPDRARALHLPVGGRLPVPARAHPRRRVSGDPEGDPRRPARAVRELARAHRGRAGERAGGDPRLPPRAGLPLSRGARARRARRPASSRSGRASGWLPPVAERSWHAAIWPRRSACSAGRSRFFRRITRLRGELLRELGSALMRIGDFARAEGVLDEALESAACGWEIADSSSARSSIVSSFAVLHAARGLRARRFFGRRADDPAARRAWRRPRVGEGLVAEERAGRQCVPVGKLGPKRSSVLSSMRGGPGTPPRSRRSRPCMRRRSTTDRRRSRRRSSSVSATSWSIPRTARWKLLSAGSSRACARCRVTSTEARSLQARSRELQEELGQRFRIVNVGAMLAAEIEELAGRPDEAVSMLRWAYDTLVEMGAASVTATIAAFLADALCLVGRYDEAEEVSRVSEDAPESDVVTQVLWRTARARAIVHRDRKTAEALAREALATAQATDYPDLEARALLSVAEVVGAGEEASAPARRSQASLRRRRATSRRLPVCRLRRLDRHRIDADTDEVGRRHHMERRRHVLGRKQEQLRGRRKGGGRGIRADQRATPGRRAGDAARRRDGGDGRKSDSRLPRRARPVRLTEWRVPSHEQPTPPPQPDPPPMPEPSPDEPPAPEEPPTGPETPPAGPELSG